MTASKGRRVVVVGTGTDVGKTHVTTALLAAARARGLSVAAYKPVATGVAESCEDAVRHAEALGAAYVPPTFAYARPVSPHLAAREEGRPVSLDAVAARSAELGAGRDLLVVEGAGGLFSPLGPSITNVDLYPAPGSLVTGVQLQGKELSYNNIADADAAWECVKGFDAPACVIVKHANPCGVAVGRDALEAYSKAFQTDPTSAFGGIIAFNRSVDGAAAQQVSKQFVEVLMAPDFTPEALDIFKAKANVRLMNIELPAGGATAWEQGRNAMDAKRVGSGLLLQTADNHEMALDDLKVVTKVQPTAGQLQDLLFAWKVAKYVKSNAIVFCANGMTMGVGAGQMSRLDSARIASIKAQHAGLSLAGTVVASDAFFPFRDGLDVVVDAGATCVIQPGGSMRDQEVIDAADARGVAMVFSGVRHFRH